MVESTSIMMEGTEGRLWKKDHHPVDTSSMGQVYVGKYGEGLPGYDTLSSILYLAICFFDHHV